MTYQEITKYANLSDEDHILINTLMKKFADDFNQNRVPFMFGMMAVLGYIRKMEEKKSNEYANRRMRRSEKMKLIENYKSEMKEYNEKETLTAEEVMKLYGIKTKLKQLSDEVMITPRENDCARKLFDGDWSNELGSVLNWSDNNPSYASLDKCIRLYKLSEKEMDKDEFVDENHEILMRSDYIRNNWDKNPR